MSLQQTSERVRDAALEMLAAIGLADGSMVSHGHLATALAAVGGALASELAAAPWSREAYQCDIDGLTYMVELVSVPTELRQAVISRADGMPHWMAVATLASVASTAALAFAGARASETPRAEFRYVAQRMLDIARHAARRGCAS